jgi:hypothetical protein
LKALEKNTKKIAFSQALKYFEKKNKKLKTRKKKKNNNKWRKNF